MKAIIDGTVFTGKNAEVIPEGVVLFEGDKILEAGAKSEVAVPEGAQVISAGGGFIMPGLVDAHQHFGHPDPREYIGRTEEHDRVVEEDHSAYQWLLAAARNGRALLRNGVTTMRSMGEQDAIDLTYKRMFEANKLLGPRVLASGKGIATTFGSALNISWVIDGPDQAREAVRKNVNLGVDWIKLFVSGGMTQGPDKVLMNRQEIEAAVDEAHRMGLKVAAHAIGNQSVWDCADLGVDTIEHTTYLITDETVDLVRKRGAAAVVSNLWAMEIYISGVKKGKREGTAEAHADGLLRLYNAGVKIGVGADCIFVGTPLADEACHMVDIGLPRDHVLQMVTRQNAEIIGMHETVGTLEKGKFADVLILAGNPLEDMAALRGVDVVIKGGAIVHSQVKVA